MHNMQLGTKLGGKIRLLWSQNRKLDGSKTYRAFCNGATFARSFSTTHSKSFINNSHLQTSLRTNSSGPSSTTAPPSTSVEYTKQNVIQILRSRGLVQEITSPELEALASQQSLSVYCGFDPTADSLHLGNLLGIIVLAWFQRCGHRPVALLGGATGRVGDPSGKSAERPVLDESVIENNTSSIKRTLEHLLTTNEEENQQYQHQQHRPLIVNNLDWFGDMSLLTFLRDIGKYARVGTMIAKESVRKRMESESGISYTEFTYQLLQGYDFVHMAREMGVRVQIGGSDQWGNIIAGTDLVRKMLDEDIECFGLTFPLLLKSDGTKFGKSEGGAVWLSPEKLSAYEFYQFLLKTTDADVLKFLKMLTFMPLEEIEAIKESMTQPGYVPNTAQRKLAEEVTRFVRGEDGLAQALNATAALAPGSTTVLDAAMLEAAAADAPSAVLTLDQVVGQTVADVLVTAGMQPSKAAARRLIKGGGVRINNVKIEDELQVVADTDLIEGRLLLLAAGKKNKTLIRIG